MSRKVVKSLISALSDDADNNNTKDLRKACGKVKVCCLDVVLVIG